MTAGNERKLESPHETTTAATSQSVDRLRELVAGIARFSYPALFSVGGAEVVVVVAAHALRVDLLDN